MRMNNSSFVEYIIDILSGFGDIKLRRMFGGYGVYHNRIMFAIIIDNEIYFKADKDLAEKYKLLGSFPFTYKRDEKTITMSYWIATAEVLEDVNQLKDWVNSSVNVARGKK